MTAETIAGAVGRSAVFRTCAYTGLKVDAAAQALIKTISGPAAASVFKAKGMEPAN